MLEIGWRYGHGFSNVAGKERKEMLDAALRQFLSALPATDVELVIHFGSHARGALRSKVILI